MPINNILPICLPSSHVRTSQSSLPSAPAPDLTPPTSRTLLCLPAPRCPPKARESKSHARKILQHLKIVPRKNAFFTVAPAYIRGRNANIGKVLGKEDARRRAQVIRKRTIKSSPRLSGPTIDTKDEDNRFIEDGDGRKMDGTTHLTRSTMESEPSSNT